jgi:Tol biopolymer transport system component
LAGAASKRAVIAFGSERGGPFRIHLLGVKPGAQQRTLQSAGAGMDVQPSWSPDGNRIAIATSDASGQNFDIAVVGANGSGRTRITTGAAWDEAPAWSPDGKWIAFASDRNGNFDIYLVHPDGTGLRKLTASTCEDTDPAWSPDGSRIVFTSRRGGFPHLWTMNANGGGERRLLKSTGWSPAWSPDGKTIAYVDDSAGDDDEIYTVGADGTNVTQLTDNDAIDDEAPTWSPDSSTIAFASGRDGDDDIFEMNADGTGVHVLVSGVWTDGDPAWRPR